MDRCGLAAYLWLERLQYLSGMKLVYAPFAARSPSLNGQPSPKDHPRAKELAELLEQDHELIQVGGNGDEQVAKDFRKGLKHYQLCELLTASDTFIAVDSYLQHAAWSIGKRGIVLFGISDPIVFGHELHLNLLKDRSFLRRNQFDLYYTNQYRPEAFASPHEVLEALKQL